jgi:hypothetical protein
MNAAGKNISVTEASYRAKNLLGTFQQCHPEQREGSALFAAKSRSFAALRMTWFAFIFLGMPESRVDTGFQAMHCQEPSGGRALAMTPWIILPPRPVAWPRAFRGRR